MFTEDLDVFFDADEHAQEIVVHETQRIITAIFDRPYADMLDVQGFTPSLTLKSADAAELLKRGYRVEIGTTIYRVTTLEPDGTGVTRVGLEIES